MRTTEHTLDLDLTSRKPVASRLAGAVRLVKTVFRILHNRTQVNYLSELDDHLLLDMGLKREDVLGAATSPFFADTAEHLTRAAKTRTQHYYRVARRS
ncbi:DUF1127 domain-containing protein [Pararhizobium sp.]|uniref:DUF1127 domain-containing protein n=1 Tax=Pararhizobium sp. TaxID=1977563 RepID=UPI00271BBEE7|nr:DUF1127 domain-containing protein [Pararhizobium sp.]MDO9415588.1 DUF1127 domain-containing protein [Pararhizobium sp.]